MKPEAKMLFGVRASQGVTFTATVATAPPHPPLLFRHAPGQSVTEVEASGNTWTFALSGGHPLHTATAARVCTRQGKSCTSICMLAHCCVCSV